MSHRVATEASRLSEQKMLQKKIIKKKNVTTTKNVTQGGHRN